jgi:hypothetical protein
VARVLFALDLGGGYGHLRRIIPLADTLAARGHTVAIALRGSAYASELLGNRPHRLIAAPAHRDPPDESTPAENWADVLLRTGHAEPGVVLCDFAPAALMAAQVAGLRTIDTGSGYTPAPRQVPMPPTRFWAQVPAARLLASEAQALALVNAARAELSAPGRPGGLAGRRPGGAELLPRIRPLRRAAGGRLLRQRLPA